DTLLGILSHGALSLGLVALAFLQGVRVDLTAYLFGDILAVGGEDIAWVCGGGALVLAALGLLWRPLLAVTVNEELARVEGIRVESLRLVFLLLMALVVAVAMKVVGILLVTALLVIPAATARRFAATPEAMALLAALLGMMAVGLGLAGSAMFDTPSGPSVVVAAIGLFVTSLVRGRG
ncbi:MAG: metal ABC transporter permease, partial [Rhodospirillales bacterium]|nr:metal ABC transporter permease [Rhodospirillales bacterium]